MMITDDDIKYMILKTKIFIDTYPLNKKYLNYYSRLL
jgi:hypothetical protein